MKTGYRKIWRDMWRSPGRTLLAVLSIASGVFAVGMISGINNLMPDRMIESYRASHPAHIAFWLTGLVDDDSLASVAHLPGVAGVEGHLQFGVRWKPDPNTAWRDATILVRQDYDEQRFNRIERVSGQWPERHSLAVEKATAAAFGIPAGGSITLEIGARQRTLQVGGVVADLMVNPPAFGGNATFYASRDMVEALFGLRGFNRIRVQLPVFSQQAADDASRLVESHLAKMRVPVFFAQVLDPGQHPAQNTVNGVMLIMSVMAILSLALGLFLVVNTINAILAQQTSHIGVMKALGATTRQMLQLYLSGVLVYGVLALLIAVPLGALAANALTGMLLGLVNVPPAPTFQLSSPALVQQISVGLLAPLLAGLWPVLAGVRITVREAISSYGIGAGYGASRIDRVLSRIRALPRPMALTLRNTFRRKGRIALTELTLIMSGLVFLMVISAAESFTHTILRLTDSQGLQVAVDFQRPVRIDEAQAIIGDLPGVDRAEMHITGSHTAFRAKDDPTGESLLVNAVPTDLGVLDPLVAQGRWLLPGDETAVVINQDARTRLNVKVGDTLFVDLGGGRQVEWTVVGSIFDVYNGLSTAYVPLHAYAREVGLAGRATTVWITTIPNDADTQRRVAAQVRAAFESRGIGIGGIDTQAGIQARAESQFGVLTALLLVLSGLIAVVGAIGLAGTLSINVLERRREIGVMRAIGGTSPTIASLFVGEGLTLGLLAWLIAVPLSIPAGQLFASAIGSVIQVDIIYRFSWTSAFMWLMIVVILSVVASAAPALRATRVSVRESLAYE